MKESIQINSPETELLESPFRGYASGTRPATGVSARTTLGCGNSRRNAYGSPSSLLLSAPSRKLLNHDEFYDDDTGLCVAK
ncbi:hypothetical protein L6452_15423 [Arctium lappa]|uniref:Uncharacterized protein n=1 Tax=Arctium lappa TaxID=4217 RepID=A0ACB9CNR2_ARCLA|nr:hypothetical protein L6452_15423 [Arctium lappa]